MVHVPAPAFAHTSGPKDSRLVLVAEAWGEQEELTGSPLVGAAGQKLNAMLRQAGLERRDCLATNVLAFRPSNNKMDAISVKKSEARADTIPFRQGKYLDPQYLGELDRLWEELLAHPRNLVVALGATATWALLGNPRITSCRGYVAKALRGGLKVLPTFHPSYVLRSPVDEVVVVADLLKAKAEAESDTIVRTPRYLLVKPTLAEMAEWFAQPAPRYAVDIETKRKQITDIGFARSTSEAMVVTFINDDLTSTWDDPMDEVRAWQMVRTALESPTPKVFQNGLYDLQYISRMGFCPKGCHLDTMLLHHALFPEQKKGLEFLGSLYSTEAAWKPMRKLTPTKRDE